MRNRLSHCLRWNLWLMALVHIWLMALQQLTASLGAVAGVRSAVSSLRRGEAAQTVAVVGSFFLFRIAGALYSPDISRAIRELQFPLLGMIFFTALDHRRILGSEGLKRLETLWFWSAVAAAGVGTAKYFIGLESRVGPPLGATVPNYVHPDQPPLGSYSLFAKFLTLTILYFGVPYLIARDWRRCWRELSGLMILGVGLLLTFSRSCWLAAGIVVGLITLRFNRRLFLLLLVGGSLLVLSTPYGRERLAHTFTAEGWTGRDVLWSIALDKMDARIIVGYGLGSFRSLMTAADREQLPDKGVGDWHNQYLQLLMESGVLGLALYLGIIFVLVAHSWRMWRSASAPPTRTRGLQGLALIGGVTIFSFFEVYLTSPVVNVVFWWLAGVTAGWKDNHTERKSQ